MNKREAYIKALAKRAVEEKSKQEISSWIEKLNQADQQAAKRFVDEWVEEINIRPKRGTKEWAEYEDNRVKTQSIDEWIGEYKAYGR